MIRPKVLVSKCIEFERCRYNSNIISSETVKVLKDHVDFIPVCAEVEIGLGIPREPVRLVKENEQIRLIQPATDRDLTEKMNDFSNNFIDSLEEIDGIILKEKSPSCGIKGAKVYNKRDAKKHFEKNSGLFAKRLLESFPYTAIEDEGRLRNFSIREHFLINIYTKARFNKIDKNRKIKELIDFHSDHKYLLMAYDQVLLKELGNLLGNFKKGSEDKTFKEYKKILKKALSEIPSYKSHINAIEHCLGYFKDRLKKDEKEFFLERLNGFRNGKLPLSVAISILRSWIVRFDEPYLKRQVYMQPYPIELETIKDSGLGRDLK